MALRVLAAVLIGLVIMGFGLASGLRGLKIVDRVNAKLPKTERFAPIGWMSWGKRGRLFAEYDRLYPGNHRVRDEVLFLVVPLAAAFLLLHFLIL
jgi:hypothetical protein